MRSDEIRSAFRDFFAANDHLVVASASLVPPSLDPSVLLTTAGMQPFKPYFLGQEPPPHPRATSTQKCFRTTDIDEVGKTARHLTFFEMMGNFSFGDYFKDAAVRYAWELVTEGWRIDPAQIWITVFEGASGVPRDDEAIELWLETGVPRDRIVALGEDNFWKAGPTGPCGPCSELFLDRGPAHGCGKPLGHGPDDCGPQCDCDRVLEFWNLVFMQYDRAADGTLTPLPRPSIDTGAGVERVSALLQGVHSVYETDGFRRIIGACEAWSRARYDAGGLETRALRVLADHGRGMAFLATDGVIPSNELRGYILRRVIRRAVAHGQRIGIQSPFLPRLHDVIIEGFGEAYPDLVTHRNAVADILAAEEERFARTLETGTVILDEVLADTKQRAATIVNANDAFRLHDTYGFPVEVTAEIAAEHGLAVDEAGFAALMDAQRRRARDAAKGGQERERAAAFARDAGFPTTFVGYDELDVETSADAVEALDANRILIKLRRSPFYPDGGGQVSDGGVIEAPNGRAVIVAAYRFDGDQTLVGLLEHGAILPGERVRALVDAEQRRPTTANHTATHLLHRALRQLLGDHVHQRGSAVRPDKLRFDFSHTQPVAADELERVEDRVNEIMLRNLPVRIYETSQDAARELGATMLFGEKYGDIVRVVDVVGYSRELCGGTHVRATAEVGPFKILSESSVGQGVRRIEAVTGAAALGLLRRRERVTITLARDLRTEPDGLEDAVERLRERIRELERSLRESGGGSNVEELVARAEQHGDIAVLAAVTADASADDLLALSDALRGRLGASVVVLGAARDGRASLVASATPGAVDAGVSAADVIREVAPIIGGGGGGRATMARAGGNHPDRLQDAITAARTFLAARLAGGA
jgi:alanyl-tRNA synthetase